MATHARAIHAEPDWQRRAQLLDWYFARNLDRFGSFSTRWYRWEYEWLRSHPMR